MEGGQEAMRLIAFVLFWAGMFMVVHEWYAPKHGLAITRAEKLYLAMALPLGFGAQISLDLLMELARGVAAAIAVIAIGVALNAWAIRRRMRRTSSAPIGL